MTAAQTIQALQSLPRMGGGGEGPQRMDLLLDRLGNPQEKLKFIHVAGTNGKGTVCAITANILTRAGYKTGLTISPYVVDFRERFQIDGRLIPMRTLSALGGKVLDACAALAQEGRTMGQFEAVTALAILWFAAEKCDFVVLETGLGGRLDPTNGVGNTLVAAITRIGLDHTQLLGDTLDKIAGEKAGILKEGCTVICYPEQPKEALGEILAAAAEKNCDWVMPQLEDFEFFDGKPLRNHFDYGGYTVHLPFPGRHQALNAAMAVEICLALWRQGYEIEDQAILEGLETAALPARIEVLRRHPLVVLDGCHNPDGAQALADQLQPIVEGGGRLIGVLGMMEDKNVEGVLEILEPVLDKVYLAPVENPRALTPQQLEQKAKFYFETEACDTLPHALKAALAQEADGVVVCGSFYLAGEARPILEKLCK